MEESDAVRASALLRGSSFKAPLQPDAPGGAAGEDATESLADILMRTDDGPGNLRETFRLLDDREARRLQDLNAAASAEGADDETKARWRGSLAELMVKVDPHRNLRDILDIPSGISERDSASDGSRNSVQASETGGMTRDDLEAALGSPVITEDLMPNVNLREDSIFSDTTDVSPTSPYLAAGSSFEESLAQWQATRGSLGSTSAGAGAEAGATPPSALGALGSLAKRLARAEETVGREHEKGLLYRQGREGVAAAVASEELPLPRGAGSLPMSSRGSTGDGVGGMGGGGGPGSSVTTSSANAAGVGRGGAMGGEEKELPAAAAAPSHGSNAAEFPAVGRTTSTTSSVSVQDVPSVDVKKPKKGRLGGLSLKKLSLRRKSKIPQVEGSDVHLRSEVLAAATNRGVGAATTQSSTPISAESVAAWTAAEEESLRKQIADFPGLHELVRQNVVMLEDVRQLIPERGDPSVPSTQAGGISLGSQESLKKLDNLVNMATILQQVASSQSEGFDIQRKELALERGSFREAYHATLRGGIYRSYLAASAIASDMVTTSKIGAIGRGAQALSVLAEVVSVAPGISALATGLKEGDRYLQTRRIVKITKIAVDGRECCDLARGVAIRLAYALSNETCCGQHAPGGGSRESCEENGQATCTDLAESDEEKDEDGKDAMEWFVGEVVKSHPTWHGKGKSTWRRKGKTCPTKAGQSLGKSHLRMVLKAVGRGCLREARDIGAKADILVRIVLPGIEGKNASTSQGPQEHVEYATSSDYRASNPSGVVAGGLVSGSGAVDSEDRVGLLTDKVEALEVGHVAFDATSADLVAQNAKLEACLEASGAKNAELVAQNVKLEASVEASNGTSAELVAQNSKLEAGLEASNATSAEQVVKNAKLEASGVASNVVSAELASQNAKLQASVEASNATSSELVTFNAKLEAGLEGFKTTIADLLSQNAKLKAGLEASNATSAKLLAQNAQLEASMEASDATSAELVAQNAQLEAGLEASKAASAELVAQHVKLEVGLKASKARNDKLEAGLEDSHAQRAELVAQNAKLKASVEASNATSAELVARNIELKDGLEASLATSDKLVAQNSELVAHNAALAKLESEVKTLKKQLKPAPESDGWVPSGGGQGLKQRAVATEAVDEFLERAQDREASELPVTQLEFREFAAVIIERFRDVEANLPVSGASGGKERKKKGHR
ncbi:unnamed protein product [Scytosiphon promiscuus]